MSFARMSYKDALGHLVVEELVPSPPMKWCPACACAVSSDHSHSAPFRRAHQQGSTKARGYGWRWQQRRARILQDEPMCRPCRAAGRYTAASQVDHIVPKAKGGQDVPANLQPICDPCHREKTAREDSHQ